MTAENNTIDAASKIRTLNDQLRTTLVGGAICITRGITERCDTDGVIAAVQAFDKFTEANDPWNERDFGALDWQGETIFWKIDYYSHGLKGGSPDATDPKVTERVLTIFLAEEY